MKKYAGNAPFQAKTSPMRRCLIRFKQPDIADCLAFETEDCAFVVERYSACVHRFLPRERQWNAETSNFLLHTAVCGMRRTIKTCFWRSVANHLAGTRSSVLERSRLKEVSRRPCLLAWAIQNKDTPAAKKTDSSVRRRTVPAIV